MKRITHKGKVNVSIMMTDVKREGNLITGGKIVSASIVDVPSKPIDNYDMAQIIINTILIVLSVRSIISVVLNLIFQ